MMERLIIGAVLAAGAVVVAVVLQRRQAGDAPTQPRSWTVPAQLDRADFVRPTAAWLVVLFSSATCETCRGVWAKVQQLESPAVAVQDVEAVADRELQARYGIDAVPSVVMADAEGVVRASFVGEVSAADLWATLAEVREPGSVPPGCDHGQPST
jgi:DNA-binding transcriptional regulator of glucitol operon